MVCLRGNVAVAQQPGHARSVLAGGHVDNTGPAALCIAHQLMSNAQGKHVPLLRPGNGVDAEHQVVTHKVTGVHIQGAVTCLPHAQSGDDLLLHRLCCRGGQGVHG
jgi:hypothetical protein